MKLNYYKVIKLYIIIYIIQGYVLPWTIQQLEGVIPSSIHESLSISLYKP
jgi:hypothetical protein